MILRMPFCPTSQGTPQAMSRTPYSPSSVTDSGRIAAFLDCATSSVYTHRSRLRHAAVCPAEDFERLVSEA